PKDSVTARGAEGRDPFQGHGGLNYTGIAGPWFRQGSDAGRYSNSDIHAIRIVATEPTTDPRYTGKITRRWWNVANERLRILGEIPVRKYEGQRTKDEKERTVRPSSFVLDPSGQPLDPDGNPDTSFLVKLPADVAWTFQTLDKDGMVLNM